MWCRSERVWKCLAVSVCPRDPHSTADSSCWRLALTTNSGSRPTTKCLAVDSQKQELQRGNRFPESKPPGSSEVKNLPAVQEVWLLDQEDPLEEGMATHSSILAWRIPWTQETGGLQSMGLRRVRHNWATNNFTFCNSTLVADMLGFLHLSASSDLYACARHQAGWLAVVSLIPSHPCLPGFHSPASSVCASIIHIINPRSLRLTMTLLSLVLTNWNISVIL